MLSGGTWSNVYLKVLINTNTRQFEVKQIERNMHVKTMQIKLDIEPQYAHYFSTRKVYLLMYEFVSACLPILNVLLRPAAYVSHNSDKNFNREPLEKRNNKGDKNIYADLFPLFLCVCFKYIHST